MRLTVGQLRALLSEAKREDKRLKLLAHGAAHMMNAKARRRFDAFVAELTSELVGPGKRCYVYTKNTGTNHTYDLRIDNSDYTTTGSVWQLKAQANLRDPMRPLILVRNSPPRWAPDQAAPESIRASIQERFEVVMSPVPVQSGAWWADENLYAIRPIYEGEDISKPPVAEWCALDPATHEPIVVKEHKQRSLVEAKTDDRMFFNPKSIRTIMDAAYERIAEWVNSYPTSRDIKLELKSEQFPVSFYVAGSGPKLLVSVQYFHNGFSAGKGTPSGTQVIERQVRAMVTYNQQSYEDALIDGEYTEQQSSRIDAFLEELYEVLDLKPSDDGLWWADENYYPIRPMIEGEEDQRKPVQTWTVVDGQSGDVVSEANAHVTAAVKDYQGGLLPGARIPSDSLVEGMPVWVGKNKADVGRVTAVTFSRPDGSKKTYESVSAALNELGFQDLKDAYEAETDSEVLVLDISDDADGWRELLYPTVFGDWSRSPFHQTRESAGVDVDLKVPPVSWFMTHIENDEYKRPHPILLRTFHKKAGSNADVLDFAVYLLTQGSEARFNDEDRRSLDEISGWGTVQVPQTMEDVIDLTSVDPGDELNGWEWGPFCEALMCAAQGMFRGPVTEAKSPHVSITASRKINPSNRYAIMKEMLHTSASAIRELLKDPWYSDRFENIKIEAKSIAGAKRLLISFWRQGMTSGTAAWASDDTFRKLMMMASLSDPMNVKVDMPRTFYRRIVSRGGYDGWKDDYQKVKTDLKQACVPEAEGKVWWADKNMYLMRPLLKGENPLYRPDPTWILIDSETHEEIPTEFVDADAFRFHF